MLEDFQPYEECENVGVRLPKISLTKEELLAIDPALSENSTSFDVLKALARKGIIEKGINKLPNRKDYYDRAKQELDTFEELGFTDYVLLNWDILKFCKREDIPTGSGRGCFVPNSKVLTSDGEKNIQDVKVGDVVRDHKNNDQEVINLLTYEIEEEIIEIQLENGEIIQCTQDHEFFTENRGWVKACELNEKDDLREIN